MHLANHKVVRVDVDGTEVPDHLMHHMFRSTLVEDQYWQLITPCCRTDRKENVTLTVMDPEEVGRAALQLAARGMATGNVEDEEAAAAAAAAENTRRQNLFAATDRALMRGDTTPLHDIYDAIAEGTDGTLEWEAFCRLMQYFLPGADEERCRYFQVCRRNTLSKSLSPPSSICQLFTCCLCH